MACDLQRYGSAGQVVPNMEVKIIDDNGNHVGPNERGEICYKSSVLFSGYFEDPEETNAAIRDGWVLSGDVGYFDGDGFLFVIDRKKDMISYNGVHLWPSELEVIMREIDGVIDACVVGIHEEAKKNDLIFSFVIKNPDYPKLTEKEISNYVNEKVGDDAKKIRGGVHFIPSFPLTPSAKVRRFIVKQIAQDLYNNKINI